uniref:Uncharacterized protein n=1 Tax=Oryza punctata TaxID=4537 RepID=A0A0E0JZH8_ORYPU
MRSCSATATSSGGNGMDSSGSAFSPIGHVYMWGMQKPSPPPQPLRRARSS